MPRGIPKNGRRRRRVATPREANLVPAIKVGETLLPLKGWEFRMEGGAVHITAEASKRRGGRSRKDEVAQNPTPATEPELVTA